MEMPRPKKDVNEETTMTDAVLTKEPEVQDVVAPVKRGPDVKQAVITISRNGQTVKDKAYPVDHVNAMLTTITRQGYRLFATHYLADIPELGWEVLYVFVRDD
jgi:hypothetical protein